MKCSLPLRERLKCSLSQIFLSNKFFSHTLLSKVNHAQNAIGRNILLNFLKEKCIISAGLDLKVWLEFPSLNVELIFSFKELIFIEIPFKHVIFKQRNPVSNSYCKSMSILDLGTFTLLKFLNTRQYSTIWKHFNIKLHVLTLKQDHQRWWH